jgi:hypothetical protein
MKIGCLLSFCHVGMVETDKKQGHSAVIMRVIDLSPV